MNGTTHTPAEAHGTYYRWLIPHKTAQRVQPIHQRKLTTEDLYHGKTYIMTSNIPISLLFILLLLSFVPSYGWCCSTEFAWEALTSAICWHQKESKGKFYFRNERLELLTRTKWKCHGERPKQFAESNNSEALERMLKGVLPKKTQKNKQWALQALTPVPVNGSVWTQQTLQREMS